MEINCGIIVQDLLEHVRKQEGLHMSDTAKQLEKIIRDAGLQIQHDENTEA